MSQVAQAFALAIVRFANPDMVKLAQAEPMQGEAPASNFTCNFLKGVKDRLAATRDGKDPRHVLVRRAMKHNRSLRISGH